MGSGRPKATSRETIAEAACELFLEQGYAETSVADIARRAGVSRSSFFNYFDSKADIFWSGLDERIAALAETSEEVTAAVGAMTDGLAPDALALALANADEMGAREELARESARRVARIAGIVSARLEREGADAVSAQVAGWALGGAAIAAVGEWARRGAGQADLPGILRGAVARAAAILP